MKKYNIKNDTMNESQLKKVYNSSIYPRDSKKYSDGGFVKIDNVVWVDLIGPVL